MGLGVGFVHVAEGSPAHLSAEQLPTLLIDSEGLHQSAGSPHILEQNDVFILTLERCAGGIKTPVFQGPQQLRSVFSQFQSGFGQRQAQNPATQSRDWQRQPDVLETARKLAQGIIIKVKKAWHNYFL